MNQPIERRFPLTPEGYVAAREWLRDIGEWEYVGTHGFSVDGLSITDTANYLWEKGADFVKHRQALRATDNPPKPTEGIPREVRRYKP